MYRAGAALRDAAAIFRAGKLELIAQHPEERRVRIDVDADFLAVHRKRGHRGLRLSIQAARSTMYTRCVLQRRVLTRSRRACASFRRTVRPRARAWARVFDYPEAHRLAVDDFGHVFTDLAHRRSALGTRVC